jgi:hypothetical protein
LPAIVSITLASGAQRMAKEQLFDLTPLPAAFVALLFGIMALYIIATEVAKRSFFGKDLSGGGSVED